MNPKAGGLEQLWLPDRARIADAIRRTTSY